MGTTFVLHSTFHRAAKQQSEQSADVVHKFAQSVLAYIPCKTMIRSD